MISSIAAFVIVGNVEIALLTIFYGILAFRSEGRGVKEIVWDEIVNEWIFGRYLFETGLTY